METDTFFWKLLKELPDALFVLLGQPLSRLSAYRFSAEEIKKSNRLDGMAENPVGRSESIGVGQPALDS